MKRNVNEELDQMFLPDNLDEVNEYLHQIVDAENLTGIGSVIYTALIKAYMLGKVDGIAEEKKYRGSIGYMFGIKE